MPGLPDGETRRRRNRRAMWVLYGVCALFFIHDLVFDSWQEALINLVWLVGGLAVLLVSIIAINVYVTWPAAAEMWRAGVARDMWSRRPWARTRARARR